MPQAEHAQPDTAKALVAAWLTNHGDALWRFAVSRVGSQHAEDILQETLLAALKAASADATNFQGRSAPETWLIGIMNHKVMDFFRKRARDQARFETAAEQQLDSAQAAQFAPDGHWAQVPADWDKAAAPAADPQSPLRAAYRACMDKLPAILRDALELRELRGLPADTVCQVLDISPTNLWTRLSRARSALRKCIEDGLNPAPPAPPARKEKTP
ncbi:MAG: sigma-70 family RNA polymerase sigma factor [Phycisphaerales bacterium]